MAVISVIVPVYNVEKYLNRCIVSILNQTFTDFELILVDDGSPDNSGIICDKYAAEDSRVKVIHKKNGGVSSARNSGLETAQGQYVTFCDSDDYVTENWLQTMYEAIISNDSDYVEVQFSSVDENGKTISEFTSKDNKWCFNSLKDNVNFIINELLKEKVSWALWNHLYKTSVIKNYKINICETCSNFAEDLNFTLKYLLHCKKIVILKDKCYYYVQHNNSMMSNSKNTVKLDALNEVSKNFGKHFFSQKYSRKINSYFPVIHYLIMYNQYRKILYPGGHDSFKPEILKINDKKWFKKYNNKIIWRYKILKKTFGKVNAQRIAVFSRFLYHQNSFIYKYERAIYYKFFYKE